MVITKALRRLESRPISADNWPTRLARSLAGCRRLTSGMSIFSASIEAAKMDSSSRTFLAVDFRKGWRSWPSWGRGPRQFCSCRQIGTGTATGTDLTKPGSVSIYIYLSYW